MIAPCSGSPGAACGPTALNTPGQSCRHAAAVHCWPALSHQIPPPRRSYLSVHHSSPPTPTLSPPRYSEAEKTNGRWAMMAVAGILATEALGLPKWYEAGAAVGADVPVAPLAATTMLFTGAAETFRYKGWKETGTVSLCSVAGAGRGLVSSGSNSSSSSSSSGGGSSS
jgi:hypothetical protein